MSVINRMLRDLDARQQHERQGSYTPAAQAPQARSWGWMVVASVLVLVGLGSAVWWWFGTQGEEVPILAETSVEATEVQPVATTPAPVVVVAQAPERTSKPARETTPEAVVETTEAVEEAPVTLASEPEPTSAPVLAAAQNTAQDKAAQPTVAPPPAPTDITASGTMEVERVALSAEELAVVKLKQAREALQNGQRERAERLFEQVLALVPGHVEARSELAAYWYGRGQIASAMAVLEQGLQIQPQQSRWQLLYARILLESGSYPAVLSALASFDLEAAEASDILQLRATAANELRRFSTAAQDYQALAQRTLQGRWWLAAAVAYEDAGQKSKAAESYTQALQRNDLNQDAQRYAQQRLDVLGEQ
ncbi:tetratricopeptide repeat protein [Pseudidiomarina sediminum]|uniref:tetratricopeptide repeat protein n=1 Tax=Pseudidiomarina sediminum TaxID=431675 RepID=UPI001C97C81A|nr:tetratricopeptide repeat protein [Pseudidiomarina sediminum]MBY6063943.1 tetratricopeptide repeat protein [Pseudidiomarina sediminum]